MTPESGIRDAIAPDSSAFWTVAPTVLERRCRAVAAVDRAMTVGGNEKRGRRQQGGRGRGDTSSISCSRTKGSIRQVALGGSDCRVVMHASCRWADGIRTGGRQETRAVIRDVVAPAWAGTRQCTPLRRDYAVPRRLRDPTDFAGYRSAKCPLVRAITERRDPDPRHQAAPATTPRRPRQDATRDDVAR
jgi:hypothetical protein